MEGSEQKSGSIPTQASHPPRLNFGIYVLVVILLYISDLFLGVWLLFSGLNLTTPYVSLSSILNWAGAWVLCYFAYRRSKTFGYTLVVLTVILTVLIIAGVFLLALFFGALSDA